MSSADRMLGAGQGLGAAFLALLCVFASALAQEIHYSPEERLDAIDAALVGA